MTYTALATVRDYNSATDTCSVELYDLGVIDAWLDGVKINANIPRGLLAFGAQVTLSMPDVNRICEAVITALSALSSIAQATGGTVQKTQQGRLSIGLNINGGGSLNVTFPVAFSATPDTLTVLPDHFIFTTLSLSNISATGFTVTAPNGSGGPYGGLYFSWSAIGNA